MGWILQVFPQPSFGAYRFSCFVGRRGVCMVSDSLMSEVAAGRIVFFSRVIKGSLKENEEVTLAFQYILYICGV